MYPKEPPPPLLTGIKMATNDKELHPAPPQAPLSTDAAHVEVDNKHDDIDMVEKVDRDALPEDVIMKSPFEDLGVKQTWSVFRKCALMCLFATFSAAAE